MIVFGGVRPALITQRDLAEERALSIELSRAAEALEEKRVWIRARLAEHWPVEDGLWRAEIIPIAGGSYQATRKPSSKLVVR